MKLKVGINDTAQKEKLDVPISIHNNVQKPQMW